ncbi:uncharacterized protein RSE6_14189 [Rhynchosporium secalis]|uniref:Uncharacterized protein n=1 Tax=Rhynchosporium secalis TaxID=38038 RepID=A0A1E1MUP4_RHYSE|nr:uncharacterized protein RSE6_14189 [Rhynchosporium secalis]
MPHSYKNTQPCPYRYAGQYTDCRRLPRPITRGQFTALNCGNFSIYGPIPHIKGPQYHPGYPERERQKEAEKKKREKKESGRRERAIKEERAKADRERRDEVREKEDREKKRREEETRKREQTERGSERRR